jgi:hypothetical protein
LPIPLSFFIFAFFAFFARDKSFSQRREARKVKKQRIGIANPLIFPYLPLSLRSLRSLREIKVSRKGAKPAK